MNNNQAEPVVLPEDEDLDEAMVQVVEIPCALRYNPETDQISIGCMIQDLEDLLEKVHD